MSPTLRIGLTGGLAAGKTTIAGWMREAGFRVVDADELVAELYLPQAPGARLVERLFGPDFLGPSGGVDRTLLAQEIFADPESRRRLESGIHPLVLQRFEVIAAEEPGVAVLEATLLVEAGYADSFDLVVTVETDPLLQLERATARGLHESESRLRLRAQGDGEQRRRRADRTIWNNGDLAELRREVDKLIEELRRMIARQHD